MLNILFNRAANGIFGKKIGRIASDAVVIQLLKSKCVPVLLYALEVCNLSKKTCSLLILQQIDSL